MITQEVRNERIKFIRAHQAAFGVERSHSLNLFETFAASIDISCCIEVSCKIEVEKLIASRFLIFYEGEDRHWPLCLDQSMKFFAKVEEQEGVLLNYSLFQEFLGDNFDFTKMGVLSTGVDLREEKAASSLKMHIRLKNYPEKLETAFSLDKKLTENLHLKDFISTIGFDFYFDGRSEIEFYLEVAEKDFNSPETLRQVWENSSHSVLLPLRGSEKFATGLSRANKTPIVYYYLKNRRDLYNYFRLNKTAQKVHSFYENAKILNQMWVGTSQEELEKECLENVKLYYHYIDSTLENF